MWIKYHESIIEKKLKDNENNRSVNLFFASLVIILCMLICVRTFVFVSVEVSGSSMENTLKSGDILLVSKLSKPKRGDIIVFYAGYVDESGNVHYSYEENGQRTLYIKRVIGIGGDTVHWKGIEVYITYETDFGKFTVYLNEPYVDPKNNHAIREDNIKGTFVPSGKYFVLGDNRDVSNDSRVSLGLIDERLVLGIVPDFVVENKDSALSFLFRAF